MWMYIALWVLALVVIIVISKYNWIIRLKNNREQSFADIDTQLQLRFDLVPNLMETVKWYATHEKDTLTMVTEARNKYMNASNADSKMEADNMLSWALKSVFALAESYPDLKANTNFLQFQSELSDIENKIAASRRFFNATTTEYNTFIQMFPNNIIANMFNFKSEKTYEVEDRQAALKAPEVKF